MKTSKQPSNKSIFYLGLFCVTFLTAGFLLLYFVCEQIDNAKKKSSWELVGAEVIKDISSIQYGTDSVIRVEFNNGKAEYLYGKIKFVKDIPINGNMRILKTTYKDINFKYKPYYNQIHNNEYRDELEVHIFTDGTSW